MRSGKLDRVVRVDHFTVVGTDPKFNTQKKDWVPLIPKLWVSKRDAQPSRNEMEKLGLPMSSHLTFFQYRFRDDVNNKMRVVELDGLKRTMSIVGGPAEVDKEGRMRMLEIACEEVK